MPESGYKYSYQEKGLFKRHLKIAVETWVYTSLHI